MKTKTNPSRREMYDLVYINKLKSKKDTRRNEIIIKNMLILGISIGSIILTIPIMKDELKTTLPIELPSTISLCLSKEARIPKVNSGRVVPKATNIIENARISIFIKDEIFFPEKTRSAELAIKIKTPRRKTNISLKIFENISKSILTPFKTLGKYSLSPRSRNR